MLRFILALLMSLAVFSVRAEDASFSHSTTVAEDAFALWQDQIGHQYQEVLRLIMEDQEKRFGIRFDAPPPRVRFIDGYSRPASYAATQNTVYLRGVFRECRIQILLGDLELRSWVFTDPSPSCDMKWIRKILKHEIGHYYVWLQIERAFPDSWLRSDFEEPEGDNPEPFSYFPVRLVSEGIAEYFGNAPLEEAAFFHEGEWYLQYSESELGVHDTFQRLVYLGGYSIVKPVMEKRGVREGVLWLIRHPMTLSPPSLLPVLRYQRQALRELSAKHP